MYTVVLYTISIPFKMELYVNDNVCDIDKETSPYDKLIINVCLITRTKENKRSY